MTQGSKLKPWQYIIVLFQGALLGLTSVGIPGLSASTMAIIIGIYFYMVNSIADLFKNFKKHILFLLTLLIGFIVGVFLAAFTITILYEKFPLFTSGAIIGLILSSIPSMIIKLKPYYKKPSCYLTFLVVLITITSYNLLSNAEVYTMTFPTPPNFVFLIGMFFIGILGSAAFVVPGVDFAVLMIAMGIYNPFMNMLTELFEFGNPDYATMFGYNAKILFAYLLGFIIGLLILTKGIKRVSKTYAGQTQFAALALVVSAPLIVIKTGIIDNPNYYSDTTQIIYLITTAITAFIIFMFVKLTTINKSRLLTLQDEALNMPPNKKAR